jgi:hypothetical protein
VTVPKPDDIRIGDAERDAVTSVLHEHFAAGRLDRDELDERLGTALAAKTQGDLKKVTVDLPGPNGMPQAERQRPGPPWAGQAPWAHGDRSLAEHGVHGHVAHHMKGHPARRHRRGPSPALPLMIIAFVTLMITVAPGRPVFGLLKLALLVLIITSVVRAVHRRRHR